VTAAFLFSDTASTTDLTWILTPRRQGAEFSTTKDTKDTNIFATRERKRAQTLLSEFCLQLSALSTSVFQKTVASPAG
jgi:hypothetical protein